MDYSEIVIKTHKDNKANDNNDDGYWIVKPQQQKKRISAVENVDNYEGMIRNYEDS